LGDMPLRVGVFSFCVVFVIWGGGVSPFFGLGGFGGGVLVFFWWYLGVGGDALLPVRNSPGRVLFLCLSHLDSKSSSSGGFFHPVLLILLANLHRVPFAGANPLIFAPPGANRPTPLPFSFFCSRFDCLSSNDSFWRPTRGSPREDTFSTRPTCSYVFLVSSVSFCCFLCTGFDHQQHYAAFG